MVSKIKQFRIPRNLVYWYLIAVAYGCMAYTVWAGLVGKYDYMMGITGAFTISMLIKNIDNKGKWSDIDTMIFIVFGLTTAAIPFIK